METELSPSTASPVTPTTVPSTTPANPLKDAIDAVDGSAQDNDKEAGSIELPPPIRADSTLEAAVRAFDDYMQRKEFSENTIKAFRNDLKIVVGYFGPDTKLMRITTDGLNEFLDWMQHSRGKSCSAKTLARRITTLKVFFGWIHGIGVLGTDPAEPVIQQPARTPLPTILREEEINRLVSVARDYLWDRKHPDARPYLLVSLLLQTGIKKAECDNLLVSDIDLSDPQAPAVMIRYAEERNKHKNRRLPLDPNILPALRQYLDQYKPQHDLFECTPRNLEYVLDEVGTRANIRSTQVGFETLRWTCAVRDFRMGMSEERLREKMGLSKISWRETREKIYRLTGRQPENQ
jgi:site-specific recombinase XerD